MKGLKNKLRALEDEVSRGKEVFTLQVERVVIHQSGQERSEVRTVTVSGVR